MLDDIRIEKIISAPIFFFFFFFFFEVSALLDVRHCPKLQSCAISTKTTDAGRQLGKKKNSAFCMNWEVKRSWGYEHTVSP